MMTDWFTKTLQIEDTSQFKKPSMGVKTNPFDLQKHIKSIFDVKKKIEIWKWSLDSTTIISF
jgi:hypothetical protein